MKSLTIEELQPGMVLARTIMTPDMVVILSENTLLSTAHITRLKFLNIPMVWIKDEYDLSANYQSVQTVFSRSNAFVAKYKDVVHTAEEIFGAVAKDGSLPVEKTNTMVHESLLPMTKESGVIDYLYELNHLASDIYNHSLRVSILAGVIAKWMNLPSKTVGEVILAGFIHDIGKTKFEKRLLDKRVQNLKGDDLEAYIAHTTDGQQILNQQSEIPFAVRLAALQHHECMDGSGFPFGSKGGEINLYARIIAVADLYDNITTEREGEVKQTPFAAIAKITEAMYTTLDPQVCVVVLKHIKDVFLGSTVVLSNGLQGTIVSYPDNFSMHPLIRITKDELLNLNDYPEIKIVEYNPK